MELVVLRMETATFAEQAVAVSRSSIVLGMHGSALIMAAFLRRGSILVELFPFGVPVENYTPCVDDFLRAYPFVVPPPRFRELTMHLYYVSVGTVLRYKTLAQELGLIYIAAVNDDPESTVAHPHRPAELGGIAHLPEAFRDKIRRSRTIPAHTCCSDPYWLYRIYSDTTVDVGAVMARLAMTVRERANAARHGERPAAEAGDLDLAPSRVTGDLVCDYLSLEGRATLRVSFSPVWDAAWRDGLVYLIHVEELRKEWITADPLIVLQGSGIAPRPFGIWVRARVAGVTGPFSRRYQCSPDIP